MLSAARYASRFIEGRSDITKRTFSSILQNVSRMSITRSGRL